MANDYQNPSLKNVKRAFEDFYRLLCDGDFVGSHGDKLWKGERGLLLMLRFFLAARFWHTYAEQRGWSDELGQRRIDYLLGDVAVEFAASTQDGQLERIGLRTNDEELRKLADAGYPYRLLVLFDLSGRGAPCEKLLSDYVSRWQRMGGTGERLTVLYCYEEGDGNTKSVEKVIKA